MVNGVSQTNPFGLSQKDYGALKDFAGGDEALLRKAIGLTDILTPKQEKIDPAMLAFLYFSRMGELASQPGATLFGSAAGAATSPAEYLMRRKEADKKADASRAGTAVNLISTLKKSQAGSGKQDIYAKRKKIGMELGLTGEKLNDFVLYGSRPPDGSESTSRMDVILKNVTDDPETPINESITSILKSKFNPELHAPASALDTTEKKDGPLTTLGKLYQDLENAVEGTAEYEAIKKQIESESKKAGFSKDIFGAEKDLRGEWTKVSNPFEKIEGNHKKLKAALEKQTGVGDMSAIFMYMKMLDPGSVVRESEFSAAQQTAGVMQQVIVLGNQLMKGDKLSPEQRGEFLALAETFYNVSKGYTDQKRGNLQFVLENNPTLKFSNVFGKQFPPPSFYLKPDIVAAANSSTNITVQKLWEEMTDAEKREYE